MSKLMDRLDRITRGASRSMGFATPGNRESLPSLVLLAWMGVPSKKNVAPLAKATVDAFVLPSDVLGVDDLEHQLKPLEGSVWGVDMELLERNRMEAYREKGCDFLIFGIEGTPVDALEEGECARILRISTDMEDSQLRGLEDLPVDIILVRKPAPHGTLSLAHLLAISNVRSATGRYLLLEWDAELTFTELEHIRDMGVDGLVINVQEAHPSVVLTLRERIDALPHRKSKGEQRPVAILPHIGGLGNARPQRQEEEEEEWEEEP